MTRGAPALVIEPKPDSAQHAVRRTEGSTCPRPTERRWRTTSTVSSNARNRRTGPGPLKRQD